jgi:hypothetical protein
MGEQEEELEHGDEKNIWDFLKSVVGDPLGTNIF